MIDSPHLARPGKPFHLKSTPTSDKGPFDSREETEQATAKLLETLGGLQEKLYAEARRSVLVVFQAMDAGGKDGAIRTVFSGVNPQGCEVTSFKVPTHLEAAHDFLWRHHLACPARGMIGIHNRSHYEAVLVERVRELVPKAVWSRRYDHINALERQLADEGTAVVKFFLHISKDEQKERLEARLADPTKHWKFNVGDLAERKLWDEYQAAYDDAVEKCSTEHAPWYVIPADRKWYRNHAIADVLVKTLEEMDPQFPKPKDDLSGVTVE